MVDGSAPIDHIDHIILGEEETNFSMSFLPLFVSDCKTITTWQMVNNLTNEVITDATIECTADGECTFIPVTRVSDMIGGSH